MKVVDPGHYYMVKVYAAREGEQPVVDEYGVYFMHRIGEGYPGNQGEPYDGTNCQELLRVLIDRCKYLQQQISSRQTRHIITLLQASLRLFEQRAWERRGKVVGEFHRRLGITEIEDLPVCSICGHVMCDKHEKDTP